MSNSLKGYARVIAFMASLLIVSCAPGKRLFENEPGTWDAFGDATWNLDQNELVGSVSGGKTGYVMTTDIFRNFELELEFKPDSTINSGVFIRCGKKEINTTDCYELNIWDTNPNQDYRTGAMVTKTKAMAKVETINQWNTYRILAEDNHIQVWVNGIVTTDTRIDEQAEGFIGLQALGNGMIRFRNVKITPLE